MGRINLTVALRKDTKSDSSEVSPSVQALKRKRKCISDANTLVYPSRAEGQIVNSLNSFNIGGVNRNVLNKVWSRLMPNQIDFVVKQNG